MQRFLPIIGLCTSMCLMAFTPAHAGVLFGIGGSSCASAMSSEYEVDRRAWILGFWSGMNYPNNNVGGQTDGAGVYGEIELVCRNNPSLPLATAALRVYNKLKAEGR